MTKLWGWLKSVVAAIASLTGGLGLISNIKGGIDAFKEWGWWDAMLVLFTEHWPLCVLAVGIIALLHRLMFSMPQERNHREYEAERWRARGSGTGNSARKAPHGKRNVKKRKI